MASFKQIQTNEEISPQVRKAIQSAGDILRDLFSDSKASTPAQNIQSNQGSKREAMESASTLFASLKTKYTIRQAGDAGSNACMSGLSLTFDKVPGSRALLLKYALTIMTWFII